MDIQGEGLDAAAEEAYKAVTQLSTKTGNDVDDDEFDFEESAFQTQLDVAEKEKNIQVENSKTSVNNHIENIKNESDIVREVDEGENEQVDGTGKSSVTHCVVETNEIEDDKNNGNSEKSLNFDNVPSIDQADNHIDIPDKDDSLVSDGFAEVSFRDVSHTDKSTANYTVQQQKKDTSWFDRKEFSIDIDEALEKFDEIEKTEYRNRINPTIKLSGLASFRRLLLGPPKISHVLEEERDFIFILAMLSYENDNELHWRILQTIYHTLTKEKVSCSRYGGHWEQIGFQGNDPATDLRGCGMLGLLTILAFLQSKDTSALARKIFILSQDEIQNFPFAIMAINVTRISLQILREEKLNKECNHRLKESHKKYEDKATGKLVWTVFQQIFSAIFHSIYTVWKNEHKTMNDSGFVMKDIENESKRTPLVMLKNYLENMKHRNDKNDTRENEKIENFVGIEDL